MRSITKAAEPARLTEYRSRPDSTYEGFPDKDELRACLVVEQRGLCCYCLSRIRPDTNSMKIEHWRSQAAYPADQLRYSNLLAVCRGNEGKPRREQHCDTHKGQQELDRNPADPLHAIEEIIQFGSDGRVSSTNPVLNIQIDSVLNLNLPFLVNNRKEVLSAFTKTLQKRGEIPRARWEQLLDEWSGQTGESELPPYCSVVAYFIRKHLRR